MSGVKVPLPLSAKKSEYRVGKVEKAHRLTSGRIGGVNFFSSSSFQSRPLNHDIDLISERPAKPSLQHNRASLFFSMNLNDMHEGTRKMAEITKRSPLPKPRYPWDCISPSDHGRTRGPRPSQCWPSIPGHSARYMAEFRIKSHTT